MLSLGVYECGKLGFALKTMFIGWCAVRLTHLDAQHLCMMIRRALRGAELRNQMLVIETVINMMISQR